jgi:hypothetical protein
MSARRKGQPRQRTPRRECLGCAVAGGRGCIIEVSLTPSAALALVQLEDSYPLMTTGSAIVCDAIERLHRSRRRKSATPGRGRT